MKNYFSKAFLLAAGFSLTWMTGCQCPANRQAGFPRILCQPVDTAVPEGKTAEFMVKASGAGLAYQWFHNDEAMLNETNSHLRVLDVKDDEHDSKLGFYHCRIDSKITTSEPGRTETRKAALGLSTIKLVSMNGTNIHILSEQMPLPPGGGPYLGPKCIGQYCTYAVSANTYPAKTTTLAVSLEKKVNGAYVLQPVSQYEVLWKYTKPATSGCATNYTDYEKRAQAVLGKKYKFNTYIKPGYCEKKGTYYRLNVYFP